MGLAWPAQWQAVGSSSLGTSVLCPSRAVSLPGEWLCGRLNQTLHCLASSYERPKEDCVSLVAVAGFRSCPFFPTTLLCHVAAPSADMAVFLVHWVCTMLADPCTQAECHGSPCKASCESKTKLADPCGVV